MISQQLLCIWLCFSSNARLHTMSCSQKKYKSFPTVISPKFCQEQKDEDVLTLQLLYFAHSLLLSFFLSLLWKRTAWQHRWHMLVYFVQHWIRIVNCKQNCKHLVSAPTTLYIIHFFVYDSLLLTDTLIMAYVPNHSL